MGIACTIIEVTTFTKMSLTNESSINERFTERMSNCSLKHATVNPCAKLQGVAFDIAESARREAQRVRKQHGSRALAFANNFRQKSRDTLHPNAGARVRRSSKFDPEQDFSRHG